MKQVLIISATILLLTACKGNKTPVTETEIVGNPNQVTLSAVQLQNASIQIGKIEQQSIASILKVNGKIDVPPQNMVSISVPLGGYLKTSKLLPGMHVNKNEVIGIVEDQQYIQLQQDYLTAKANIVFLEKEYNRQKELNQSQASSDKVFQQAESEFRSKKILITALTQKLLLAGININAISENNISRSVNIVSPINGFVTKVNVNIGKYVSPTDVLFELVNPSDIHLALQVFEKDIDKLFIGQPLIAYTNNQPKKKYDCEILLIGKELSINRNTEVHCHFEAYDKTLIPGTYMNAEIAIKNKESSVLPAEAVVQFESKHYIFKAINNNKFEMLEVNIGETEKGFTAIFFTANEAQLKNDNFVIKGAYALLMSLKNKSEE